MDDKHAIRLLKKDDLTGLEVLVKQYQVQAIHSAQLILRDRGLSEEVVQISFIRAAEKIDQFDENRDFKPWFLRIVINNALKVVHRNKKFVPWDDESDESTTHLAQWMINSEPLPEEQLIQIESIEDIRKLLDTLTPELRAVIVMRYYLEMSEAEMTELLGRPPSTIKWWLRSARKRLRSLLPKSSKLENCDKGG